jgi:hypothetical protein
MVFDCPGLVYLRHFLLATYYMQSFLKSEVKRIKILRIFFTDGVDIGSSISLGTEPQSASMILGSRVIYLYPSWPYRSVDKISDS